MDNSWNKVVSLVFMILSIAAIAQGLKGKKATERDYKRNGRLFSLFNIVQFQQSTCPTINAGMFGTCMTNHECSSAGGVSSGHCAAGFGTCCMFSVNCGTAATVSRNCTYIQNDPGAATPSTMCTVTFNRITQNLCQIRLDFVMLVTVGPIAAIGTTVGQCAADSVTVTGDVGMGAGASPPVVCGSLSGQHMYLETGPTGTAGMIAFKFTTPPKSYKVKVTYYTCDSPSKAPPGCVQYFTGAAGTFTSYNWNMGKGVMLDMQNFATCIRQEQGFCKISYSQTSPTSFSFVTIQGPGNTFVPVSSATNCIFDFVMIPNADPGNDDTFCGGVFNPQGNFQTVPGTVVEYTTPFQVDTYSLQANVLISAPGPTGYSLNYAQIPCS